jgi:hypothetical protein
MVITWYAKVYRMISFSNRPYERISRDAETPTDTYLLLNSPTPSLPMKWAGVVHLCREKFDERCDPLWGLKVERAVCGKSWVRVRVVG